MDARSIKISLDCGGSFVGAPVIFPQSPDARVYASKQ